MDLDGVSIVPLLKEPNKEWGIPAVSEFRRGQCSVRSERYRYIQYSDGTSELYDHYNDPNEWNNLSSSKTKEIIKSLSRIGSTSKLGRKLLFLENLQRMHHLKEHYEFDPHSYEWIHKQTGTKTTGK